MTTRRQDSTWASDDSGKNLCLQTEVRMWALTMGQQSTCSKVRLLFARWINVGWAPLPLRQLGQVPRHESNTSGILAILALQCWSVEPCWTSTANLNHSRLSWGLRHWTLRATARGSFWKELCASWDGGVYTKHVLRECCAAELASWSKFLKFLKTLFHGFSRAKSNSVLQSSGSLLVISCFQKLMISVRKVAVGTLLTGSQVKELTSDQIRSGRQTMSRVTAGKGVEHKLQISKSLWFRKTMRADEHLMNIWWSDPSCTTLFSKAHHSQHLQMDQMELRMLRAFQVLELREQRNTRSLPDSTRYTPWRRISPVFHLPTTGKPGEHVEEVWRRNETRTWSWASEKRCAIVRLPKVGEKLKASSEKDVPYVIVCQQGTAADASCTCGTWKYPTIQEQTARKLIRKPESNFGATQRQRERVRWCPAGWGTRKISEKVGITCWKCMDAPAFCTKSSVFPEAAHLWFDAIIGSLESTFQVSFRWTECTEARKQARLCSYCRELGLKGI